MTLLVQQMHVTVSSPARALLLLVEWNWVKKRDDESERQIFAFGSISLLIPL